MRHKARARARARRRWRVPDLLFEVGTEELPATYLPPAIERALSFPKSMRWRQAPGLAFPRPIRRLMALFGREVIPVSLAGLQAGRTTVGHPFLDGRKELDVEKADYAAYRALLKSHAVI